MSVALPRAGTRRRSKLRDTHPAAPYLFLLPHAALFLVFMVFPVLFGAYVSVHRWDVLAADQPFVGLQFFAQLFSREAPQSREFWNAMFNTALFTGITVPLLTALSLFLAVLLARPLRGRAVFRAIFFMPGILSVTVVSILFKWVFENQSGLVNIIATQYLGRSSVPYITGEGLAWIPIVLATLWWSVGFNMTLYAAALAGIPRSYYEAAELDGAGTWAQFRFVTLPLLAPTTLFVVVTTAIGSFGLFGQPQLITGGGPTDSTRTAMMVVTDEAFRNSQVSSATAMAFVFGAVLLVLTAIQFRFMTRGGEEAR